MQQIQIKFGESVTDDVLEDVQRDACEDFGGFTLLEGDGGYVGDDELYIEDCRVLVVDVIAETDRDPAWWAEIRAEYLREKSDEEAVLWTVTDVAAGGLA